MSGEQKKKKTFREKMDEKMNGAMGYWISMGSISLPVMPEKIQQKIKGQNKTISLIDGTSVNLIKPPGLTEFEFEIMIPASNYTFNTHKEVLRQQDYLDKFEILKKKKKPFLFIIWRNRPGLLYEGYKTSTELYATNMKVTLEDYTIKEDAGYGNDIMVSISLKEYIPFGTKTVKKKRNAKGKETSKESKNRDSSDKKKNKKHKVLKGDTLWNLAKKYYGKETMWKTIYRENEKVIEKAAKDHGKASSSNGHWIYPGTVLKLPEVG